MRTLLSISVVAAGLLFAGQVLGQQAMSASTPSPVAEDGAYAGGGRICHNCGGRLLHPLCLGCGGGRDPGDNCACHGSYKYPVPSQSTFFWPGIYSAETMTQYISPWRYPGLKPIPEYWKLDPTNDTSPYSGYRY